MLLLISQFGSANTKDDSSFTTTVYEYIYIYIHMYVCIYAINMCIFVIMIV